MLSGYIEISRRLFEASINVTIKVTNVTLLEPVLKDVCWVTIMHKLGLPNFICCIVLIQNRSVFLCCIVG